MAEFRNYQQGKLPAGPGARSLTDFFASIDGKLGQVRGPQSAAQRLRAEGASPLAPEPIRQRLTQRAAALEQAAAWIGGYAGDDLLVAHNAPFDMSVLRQACAADKIPVPGNDYVCTLALARQACQLPSHRLPEVAAEFGIRLTAHHDASADARCAAQIAVAMARRHGHDKLEQLAQSFHVPVGHLAS